MLGTGAEILTEAAQARARVDPRDARELHATAVVLHAGLPAFQLAEQAAADAGGAGAGAAVEVWTVMYDFDGVAYGAEYLAICVGDKVSREKEDGGWALGTVVQHAKPGSARGPPLGWYPAEFAKRPG